MAVPARPVAGALLDAAWGGIVHDMVVASDIQRGTGSVTFSAATLSAVAAVTFPRPFATDPAVVLGARGGPHYNVNISAGPTNTGFSMQGRRTDGGSPTATMSVDWIAIGPRA